MAGPNPPRRFRGIGDLKLAARQVYYEQLNFWLNPIGAIFTVGFSVVFLVLVGSTAGHQHSSAIGGGLLIDYYVPGFIAYGVMAACFNTLTINLVVRREMGLLKRVRLSPLPSWAMMAAISASALIISLVQVVLVLLIGKIGYSVSFPHNLPALVVVLVIGAASFTALGLGVSTLIPNQESGAPVTSILFFVLLFLSGLWFPLSPPLGAGEVLVLPARATHDRRRLRRDDRPEGSVELALARPFSYGDLGRRSGSRGCAALELGSASGHAWRQAGFFEPRSHEPSECRMRGSCFARRVDSQGDSSK